MKPHVHHRVGLLAPDAPHDAVLQDAQQLGLQRHRHLAELVEEERAAVGRLEEARLVAVRAVNAPFLWPNISLSSSAPGIAAQFTATRRFALRGCCGG
jgi:hypothetical protein